MHARVKLLQLVLAALAICAFACCSGGETSGLPRLEPPSYAYVGFVRDVAFAPQLSEGDSLDLTTSCLVPDRPWLLSLLPAFRIVSVLVEPSQENEGVYRLLVRGLDVGFGYDDSYVHQDVQQPPYVELTMHFPDTEDGNYMIGSEPLAVGTYEVLIYSGDPPAGSWLIDGQGSGRWASWGTFEVVPAEEGERCDSYLREFH